MPEEANPKSRKREPYAPDPKTLSLLRVSGNPINGLGETKVRRASPFFWHPPDQHPYGDLQMVARQNSRIATEISSRCVSSAKWPVGRN